MSSELFTLVFPDGTTEYRSSARPPAVGGVFRHLGEDLVVDEIGSDERGDPIVTFRRPGAESEI
jgi:hypothetical protein